MNKAFLIFLAVSMLALPEKAVAFECTRESVYREFNELKSKIEQETRALQERHARNRRPLDGLLDGPGAGSSAFGRIGQKLYRERLQKEAQERSDMESRHRKEIYDFKELVTLLCK
jgi:hypothetical protein